MRAVHDALYPPLKGEGRSASSGARCDPGWGGGASANTPHPDCRRFAPAVDPPPSGEGEEHLGAATSALRALEKVDRRPGLPTGIWKTFDHPNTLGFADHPDDRIGSFLGIGRIGAKVDRRFGAPNAVARSVATRGGIAANKIKICEARRSRCTTECNVAVRACLTQIGRRTLEFLSLQQRFQDGFDIRLRDLLDLAIAGLFCRPRVGDDG